MVGYGDFYNIGIVKCFFYFEYVLDYFIDIIILVKDFLLLEYILKVLILIIERYYLSNIFLLLIYIKIWILEGEIDDFVVMVYFGMRYF